MTGRGSSEVVEEEAEVDENYWLRISLHFRKKKGYWAKECPEQRTEVLTIRE